MTDPLPPPEQPLPAARLAASEKLLVEAVAQGAARRRRIARWSTVGLTALVAFSGGVATALVIGEPPTVRPEIRCYTEASLTGGDHFKGTTLAAASRDGTPVDVATDATSHCAALWRQVFWSRAGRMPSHRRNQGKSIRCRS